MNQSLKVLIFPSRVPRECKQMDRREMLTLQGSEVVCDVSHPPPLPNPISTALSKSNWTWSWKSKSTMGYQEPGKHLQLSTSCKSLRPGEPPGQAVPLCALPRAAAGGHRQEELTVGLSRSLLMLSHADPLAHPVICACILRTTLISLQA